MSCVMQVNIEDGLKVDKKVLFEYIQKLCLKGGLLCLISYGVETKAFISFDKSNVEEVTNCISEIDLKIEKKYGCSLIFPYSREEKIVNGKTVLGLPTPNLEGSIFICSAELV